jgi:hypothetical protein
MDTGNTGTLLTVFSGLVAVALLLQSLAMWGLHRSLRNVSARVDGLSKDLVKTADSISGSALDFLSSARGFVEKLSAVQENVTATSAVIHKRVVELDAFLDETTKAAQLQIVRIQEVVDTASRRVEETVSTLQNGVLTPVNEAHAIAAGVKAGLGYFFRNRKRPSSRSHQDEEMFI